MKIRLALLDNDTDYLNRLVAIFNAEYTDKLEIYSFTVPESAINNLISANIDVFVANVCFDIDLSCIPNECGFAYFTDNDDVDTINGQRAISKFQNVDLTYCQILNIYSEKAINITGVSEDNGKIIIFSSPSGGVGTSTIAASCAVSLAASKKKVLYLNLEKFGGADGYFSGEGQFDFEKVIFALKSKSSNLPLKLRSYVKKDRSGVFFYSQPQIALDMLEFSYEDTIQLINEIKQNGEYEYIIVDMDFVLSKEAIDADFVLSKEFMELYKLAMSWVWVNDGTLLGNMKTKRAYDALVVLDQNNNTRICDKLLCVYNKYDKHSSKIEEVTDNSVGVIPFLDGLTTKQVIDKIAHLDIFKKIMG